MKALEAIFTLESIFNLGKAFGDAIKPEEILKVSILSIMGKLKLNKVAGFIFSGDKFKQVYSNGIEIDNEFSLNRFEVPLKLVRLKPRTIEKFPQKLQRFIRKNSFDYILPINWIPPQKKQNNYALGVIFIKAGCKNFTKAELDYINFVLNFTAISLKNILSLAELKKNVYNLTILNEFMLSVLLKKSEEEIFNSLALILMGHFRIKNVGIVKVENGMIKTFSLPQNQTFPTKSIKKILKLKTSTISPSKINIKNFSLAIVQSSVDGERNYVLLIGGKGKKQFKTEEIDLIRSFLASSINAVENLKMLSLEYDMKLAYEIQKNLLPTTLPKDERIDIYAVTIPSKLVSGDYYDVIKINNDEFIIVIADVCGKGVSASLLMSNLQASLKSILLFTDDLKKVVNLLNKIVLLNTPIEQFITFFICKLNLKNFVLEYVNAGHNPPVLLSGDKVKFLEEGGTVLGVFESKYKSKKVKINPGDLLFLYTDGVTEAVNMSGVELGIDKIIKVIKAHRTLSANKIIDEINKLISNYAYSIEQLDDITMVIVKFLIRQTKEKTK
ncbi:PP2C family protein-serine/threonine phosphatase [Candidatus Kryptobacter tengchongensis]|uniref:PP2C family protein-serine/threonine phosphatase n=1 Tax=Kryptobacter tengchongensis TaxID=1643429 RepID=UPI000707D3A8|nr:PP2C family protein-serine/threonine phosphatase [Candidatus Kryptobacter tengchongensis]CUS85557.1 sigma-B regulation protein RsbU (phosphoserine phosphatase) [Candidatus Kryptobacter tengchongensis]